MWARACKYAYVFTAKLNLNPASKLVDMQTFLMSPLRGGEQEYREEEIRRLGFTTGGIVLCMLHKILHFEICLRLHFNACELAFHRCGRSQVLW